MFTDTYETLELMFTNNRYFIQISPKWRHIYFCSHRRQIQIVYISIELIDKMKQTVPNVDLTAEQ